MQDHQHAFQTHARIHVGLSQRLEAAVVVTAVAHHHVIPHLHPTRVTARGALWWCFSSPHEDFGVGTAGSRWAVRPPVLLAGQFHRHAEPLPRLKGLGIRADLLIAAEHGAVQPGGPDTEAVARQLISQRRLCEPG